MEHLETRVPVGRVELTADVSLPDGGTGLVLFAHGSGSSRRSPRNRQVAEVLNRRGIGTVLIDLLTPQQEATDHHTTALRFDIGLLGDRLIGVTDWIVRQPRLMNLELGYFGASTGAAAALVAAAKRPNVAKAVVSRGGRPDLAGSALRSVRTPTLFLVGGEDLVVLGLHHEAIANLPPDTPHKLEVIEGASHLFEEPGALDRVAGLATDWFYLHLKPPDR
jgi:dienelactone hydrolase